MLIVKKQFNVNWMAERIKHSQHWLKRDQVDTRYFIKTSTEETSNDSIAWNR